MIASTPSLLWLATYRNPCAKVALTIAISLLLASCQSTPQHDEPPTMVLPAAAQPGTGKQDSEHALPALVASPVTGNSIDNKATWQLAIDPLFAKAKALVENQLRVDLSDITLQLIDDSAINTEVAFETNRLITEQFGDTRFAGQFLDKVMQPLAGTYAALYSSRLRSVMISRSMLASYERSLASQSDGPDGQAALLALLIHELVHAADDKRYNIHDNRALNFRASFAQSATFEGHAQWVTRQICEVSNCSAGLKALDNFMFSADETNDPLAQPIEAVSRSVLEYSYIEGERFVKTLSERSNGKQLIDDLLSQPPADPLQILAPDTYPDTLRETRNQRLLSASRDVSHPWASAPWIGIETSPLKGIDLRSDPVRRQAAIDGFTKLIQAMVSIQFYNEQLEQAHPMEATILQAESAHTANLFASILHNNTQLPGAEISVEPFSINRPAHRSGAPLQMRIYRTAIDAATRYRTSIVVSGTHVVQVSGNTNEQQVLDDYAVRVLLNLHAS